MAVGREFGEEKHLSESSERIDRQNPPNPKIGKPENIDILVSRFLEELGDISSEIDHDGDAESTSRTEPELRDDRPATQFRVPNEAPSGTDPDPDKINDEIERSLAELESLRSSPAPPEEDLPSSSETMPAAAELPQAETRMEPAKTPTPAETEEQAWDRLELFRSTIAARRWYRRFSLGWVLVGTILAGILAVAAFLFSGYLGKEPEGTAQVQNDQPVKPVQKSDTSQRPEATERPDNSSGSPDRSKSANQTKTSVQDSGRKAVSARARNAGAGGSRVPEPPAAKPELRRLAQNDSGGAPAERPKMSEEPSRSASQLAAGMVPVPSEQSSPAVNPPVAATPPKPIPAIPSGTPGTNSGISITPPTVVPVPEAPPAAPKPAPAAETEAGNAAAEPKPRTASIAEILTKVNPSYPPIARSQRVFGKVDVEASIDEKGNVVSAKAVSGPNLLRLAAEQAVMKWKFKPASVGGVSVPSKANISVSFNLQ